MLLIGFLWLLYAQVALAASKAHAFEIVLSYLGYQLQRRMYGDAQKFLFPLQSPISGKTIPANAGPDGKGLSFQGFVRLYLKKKANFVVKVDLDLDNPVRTGELLLDRGLNGIARVPYMKGVEAAEAKSTRLMDYGIFTQELTETYDLAAKTFGTGPNSPVYKELAAFEPLAARIRQVRLDDMRMAENMAKDIVEVFKGIDSKTARFNDPIDILSDTKAKKIIKERFKLGSLPDDDPKIKAEWKSWLDGIGSREAPANKDAPSYSELNQKHFFVLNEWIGMEKHLRCEAKRYLG
ncbi:hypothetical protein ColLi_12759 [Colletotrichum liriopes]|uniref:Uncharacterized protein n=1 Tax=Colletotrichum liriopes TaxID=708192 RepID=A0AA37LZU4_9PEZI|nr:hypothetical protein ColLi_12759 [Colletotrichum liriopes]